jgi:hypothetical protein
MKTKKRITRAWKHNGKNRHQYGNRNEERYQTPFMILDENYIDDEEEEGLCIEN